MKVAPDGKFRLEPVELWVAALAFGCLIFAAGVETGRSQVAQCVQVEQARDGRSGDPQAQLGIPANYHARPESGRHPHQEPSNGS